jgi:hypothetical protein
MYVNGRGGLHVTYLTDSESKFSRMDDDVISNVIEFTRAFFPTILYLFSENNKYTRGLQYRRLNKNMKNGWDKYDAINYRRWGVEIRLLDGTNDWDLIETFTKFYSAVFMLCADVCTKGMFKVGETHILKVNKFRDKVTQYKFQIPLHKFPVWSQTKNSSINKYMFYLLRPYLEEFNIYEKVLKLFNKNPPLKHKKIKKKKVIPKSKLVNLTQKEVDSKMVLSEVVRLKFGGNTLREIKEYICHKYKMDKKEFCNLMKNKKSVVQLLKCR